MGIWEGAMASLVDFAEFGPTKRPHPGPETPQRDQEDESRYEASSRSVLSLAERFEALSPSRPRNVITSAGSNFPIPRQSSSELSCSGDEQIITSIDDANEPILQENTERFCLLPVK